jgi:hypothetical protein
MASRTETDIQFVSTDEEHEQALRDLFESVLSIRRRLIPAQNETDALKAEGTRLFEELKSGLSLSAHRKTTKRAKD